MSVLEAGREGWFRELAAIGIDLLWHPSTSEASAGEVLGLLNDLREGRRPLDILCVEGSIMRGPGGTGRFQMFGGTGRPVMEWVRDLAGVAEYVVAVGSCATFGGIPAGGGNITEACGLQFEGERVGALLPEDFLAKGGLPVVNVGGCAPHPGWIMETLESLVTGELTREDLDHLNRPRFFTDHLAHHGCSRNEFYEFKASAQKLSDRGCLMEHLGCKATQAAGDCNIRSWNGGGSCTNAGYACIACTSPGFEHIEGFLETPKVAGIPVGLPTDMPKAWFVALAALSKSATPDRVRRNAQSDHVVVAPVQQGRTDRK
jgi:ferredoxin hydrogenase small subunit